MQRLFSQLVKNNTPEVNADVVNGLATKMMPYAEQYIDDVFRAASRTFPEGLEYVGCKRCTPLEEFNYLTRVKGNSRRSCEMAHSDLYYMKYYFTYKGIELPPRYLYLPFVGEANTITISGSQFVINAVLYDKVISPNADNVFVRLLRDKIIFRRLSYSVRINNVRKACQVVYTHLYRNAQRGKRESERGTKLVTNVTHYLIARFGLSGFFKQYFDFEPIIKTGKIDTNLYSTDEYAIISSTGIKPKSCTAGYYKASEIKILVPWDKYTPVVEDVMASIFYVIDHFPDKVTLKWIDDPRTWMQLLGMINFSDSYNTGKLLEKTQEHFNSLDEYIDPLVSKKLAESGYPCKNFYDLLVVVIEHFTQWVVMSSSNVNSMFGKELSVLYPVFYSITSAIFNTAFKLNKLTLRKRDRDRTEITDREIIEHMNKTLKPGMIFSLTGSDSCATSTSYPGDNKFFKLTCTITPQTGSQTGGSDSKAGKKRIAEEDPSNKLHPSIAVAGGYLNLPKKTPTGTTRINPFVRLDASGTILQDPDSQPLLEDIQSKLRS